MYRSTINENVERNHVIVYLCICSLIFIMQARWLLMYSFCFTGSVINAGGMAGAYSDKTYFGDYVCYTYADAFPDGGGGGGGGGGTIRLYANEVHKILNLKVLIQVIPSSCTRYD